MAQNQSYHIGKKIKAVHKEQRWSVSWLAEQLNCHCVNIYNIFERQTIDCDLLLRISIALKYNFFEDYAAIYKEKIMDK